MNKLYFGVLVFGLAAVLSLNVVSAQADLTSYWIERTIQGAEDFFSPFFEVLLNSSRFDEFFFVKILFLFLMFLVVKIVLNNAPIFKEQKGAVIVISAIISLISVRYMVDLEVIRGILIPYGTLAVAITTFLPFLIYFYVVHKTIDSGIGRKIAWIAYLIILSGIWFNRYDELNEISNYIYLGVFVLALCLFFFDKRVRQYFGMAEINEALRSANRAAIAHLQEEYARLSTVTTKAADDRRKEIAKKLRKMGANPYY